MPRTIEERAAVARCVRSWKLNDVELRAGDAPDTRIITGYASVFDAPYDVTDMFGTYREQVKPGAFDVTLSQQPDVQLLVNHGGLPLARTTNRSLQLSTDRRGLRVEADVSLDEADAALVARKVERGLMDEMSFAFWVTRQNWSADYTQRDVLEVNLHRGDVSVVNYGANPATSVALRSYGIDPDEFDARLVEVRAGRVLSGANYSKIVTARDSLDEVIAAAEAGMTPANEGESAARAVLAAYQARASRRLLLDVA